MRKLTDKEKHAYFMCTGKQAPACVVQKAPFFANWQGLTLWRLILIRDYERHDVAVHEAVHVEQFKWGWGMIKYLYYLAKYGYRQNPYEVEAYAVQACSKAYL